MGSHLRILKVAPHMGELCFLDMRRKSVISGLNDLFMNVRSSKTLTLSFHLSLLCK